MTLGLNGKRLRHRRRWRFTVLKWLLILGALIAAGFYAYQTGSVLAQYEVRDLRGEISRLTDMLSDLRQERDALAATVEETREREETLRQRYSENVPTGEAERLFTLVQEQLEAGIGADRLAFVIAAVNDEASCDGEPQTRRFILRTPFHQGGNDSIGFAQGMIRITGEGQPATDAAGNREAWFDPALPVTLQFAQPGGAANEAAGVLPLHHSVLLDSSEYRFTIVAGDRGFVNVTGDRCDYP